MKSRISRYVSFKRIFLSGLFLFGSLHLLSSCSGDPSFSLTSDSGSFTQVAQQKSKVDILWVIDDSSSMTETQSSLTTNFTSFISDFTSKNYDFQIAVTSVNAYRAEADYNPLIGTDDPSLSEFRDGGSTNSGVFVITPDTPDVINTFVTNATLGATGFSDERAFSSLEETLNNPQNTGFIRDESFLAIIIVSNEDDISHDGNTPIFDDGTCGGSPGCTHPSGNPALHPISRYTDYLDTLTSSTVDERKYSVSTISIPDGDTACVSAQIGASGNGGQKFGIRYEALATATDGDIISICAPDFGLALDGLAAKIIESSLQEEFILTREPLVSTILIKVNGITVPMSVSGSDGWTYSEPNPGEYTITFIGTAIPNAGESIDINFEPVSFQE